MEPWNNNDRSTYSYCEGKTIKILSNPVILCQYYDLVSWLFKRTYTIHIKHFGGSQIFSLQENAVVYMWLVHIFYTWNWIPWWIHKNMFPFGKRCHCCYCFHFYTINFINYVTLHIVIICLVYIWVGIFGTKMV